MRIRQYMVMGLFSVVVCPWMVYLLIHLLTAAPWRTPDGGGQTLPHTLQAMARSESEWSDPNWQQEMKAELGQNGLEAVIRSPGNRVIFASAPYGRHHWGPGQQAVVLRDGRVAGTVQVSPSWGGDPLAAIGAVLTAVLAVVFVSYQIGRNVIRPLESMSRAALQIAEGDLDLALAPSNTTEIRQVRQAFLAMLEGLREAFAKQRKLEEERRFFIGAIAHDLRTPLFSLRGHLDGIEQGIASSPEKLARYVAVCQDKAAHLDRLIADLFAFTRLEYLEQTLRMEPADLSEIAVRTAAGVAHSAEAQEILLETELPADGCPISGDPHLLERAITNLLDNALRYTPAHGEITLSLRQEPERAVLQIRDTGPGFAAEDLAHLFEPMYRGDASRNQATGGAGLGLTIARRVFRSHGGDLTAENSPDGGALLTGWIPTNKSIY